LDAVPSVQDAPEEQELETFDASLIWLTRRIEADLLEEGVDESALDLPQFDAPVDFANPASTSSVSAEQRRVMALAQASGDRLVTLRTPSGEALVDPGDSDVEAALRQLVGPEPSQVALSREPDNVLVLHTGGRAAYDAPEGRVEQDGLSTADLIFLVEAYLTGDFTALLERLRRR
jgi:hypothetical protein